MKKKNASCDFLLFRNIAAGIAVAFFLLSFFKNPSLFRGIGYVFGAVAYLMELIEMTECFKKKASFKELFMAICFCPVYVLMGIHYLSE